MSIQDSSFRRTQKSNKKSLSAWLLQYQQSKFIALPINACQEILEYPEIHHAPAIAKFGYGLIHWRNQWLPLIDLASLLTGAEKTQMTRHCLIVAYFDAGGEVEFVGLSLPYMPHTVSVSDDLLCALPEGELWQRIAPSCIRYNNTRVPIVNTSKLFGR